MDYCPTCHRALPPTGTIKSPRKVNHAAILKLLIANPDMKKRAVARLYASAIGCSVETANMRVWRVAKKYALDSIDIQKPEA